MKQGDIVIAKNDMFMGSEQTLTKNKVYEVIRLENCDEFDDGEIHQFVIIDDSGDEHYFDIGDSEFFFSLSELRHIVALERIYYHNIRANGRSFLSYIMGELAHYALTGKLTENPNWAPEKEDLDLIDNAQPVGIKTIKEEYKKECDKDGESSGFEE